MAIPVDLGLAVFLGKSECGVPERNMPEKYFLILFICYLPVYLSLVFYLRTKINGYSMRAHMVSYLATSDEPWRSIFNVSTILYGGLSFVVPISLNMMLGGDHPVTLGAASLLATGLATILVGFFPMDRKLKIHNAVGFFAFFSALLAGFSFLSIFNQGLLNFPLMEGFNVAVICITLLLGISLLFRRQESSLLEWMAFLCTIAWNFLLATLLLLSMH
jgi:hypothetical membrane protein